MITLLRDLLPKDELYMDYGPAYNFEKCLCPIHISPEAKAAAAAAEEEAVEIWIFGSDATGGSLMGRKFKSFPRSLGGDLSNFFFSKNIFSTFVSKNVRNITNKYGFFDR